MICAASTTLRRGPGRPSTACAPPALLSAVEFAVEDLPAAEVMRLACQLDARLGKNGE